MARLAGYIGATGVELAMVSRYRGQIKLDEHRRYTTASYRSFDQILKSYLNRSSGTFDLACFGAAGLVRNGVVGLTNHTWTIGESDLIERHGFRKVSLMNNIEAAAYGLVHLSSDNLFQLSSNSGKVEGNFALLSAGTGLGEAIVYSNGDSLIARASEGGHADFAPGNQQESELWAYLYSELGRVTVEDVVSRGGLERIFNFFKDTEEGELPGWFKSSNDPANAIIEQALSGKDETAVQAVELQVDCLATEAANLALKGMSTGGVYLAGSLPNEIIPLLDKGRFMERFVRPGKMEEFLSRIPVSVIINENTPLLGAATVALDLK